MDTSMSVRESDDAAKSVPRGCSGPCCMDGFNALSGRNLLFPGLKTAVVGVE